jgi:hypothetical protein
MLQEQEITSHFSLDPAQSNPMYKFAIERTTVTLRCLYQAGFYTSRSFLKINSSDGELRGSEGKEKSE